MLFLENMGRKKMGTVTNMTFDFHLNKLDNQVHQPFPLANMIGDTDKAHPGWEHAEWEHLYWDDAFLASTSLNLSTEALMTFSILDVVNCNSLHILSRFWTSWWRDAYNLLFRIGFAYHVNKGTSAAWENLACRQTTLLLPLLHLWTFTFP